MTGTRYGRCQESRVGLVVPVAIVTGAYLNAGATTEVRTFMADSLA